MKAVSLFLVFVLAKLLILAGRTIPLSFWTPFAYLWQDLLVAFLFAALDHLFRRRLWFGWSVYGAVVLYTAINVPVCCVLATPLTWPLLYATRVPLADSISYHMTAVNLLRVAAVLIGAAILPLLLRMVRNTLSPRVRIAAIGCACIGLFLGPFATTRIATHGLHRNVLAVLVTTALPRITAVDLAADWRASPFGSSDSDDLSRFRGAATGRNVVVIHLESTGARYLRPYGAALDPMPNLTKLTRQAILFENAYTTYPETIKSFFAVQCALFPAVDTKPETYEHVSSPSLASVLAAQGYRTGLFHSGRFMYLGMESVIRNRGYEILEDAGDIGGEQNSSFGIDETSTVRRILAWVDALPCGSRFLVNYLPIAGHHPYATFEEGPFPEDDEIGRYRNALHESDAALGQLVQGLRSRGLEQNTLFVIFGDHGEAFGQHAGNYGHTLFLYEENVHVPLIIAAAGLLKQPLRLGRVASLVDTTPTILDLLGLSIPTTYQGHSLLDGQSEMALFCTDYSLGFLGLRDGRWKLVHELESGQSKFYDLEEDPDERQDLSARFLERAEVYRARLLRWAAAQKYLITKS